MKLGVHIGYWGWAERRRTRLNIVKEAERLGYDSVWTAEAYGSDAATVLAWLAGARRRSSSARRTSSRCPPASADHRERGRRARPRRGGVQEAILVSQDTLAYGRDLPGNGDIGDLLLALGETRMPWVRPMYLHPRT